MTSEVVGYTTGVYDLFHVGHLNLLQHASAQCDRLIVGVTTDELAAARKGKVPVVPFDERAAIVGAIECVDDIVPQADMDKVTAWEELAFDKMFVGSDWQGTPAWEAYEEEFAPLGVEIVYLPYTLHTSSTQLRNVLDRLAE